MGHPPTRRPRPDAGSRGVRAAARRAARATPVRRGERHGGRGGIAMPAESDLLPASPRATLAGPTWSGSLGPSSWAVKDPTSPGGQRRTPVQLGEDGGFRLPGGRIRLLEVTGAGTRCGATPPDVRRAGRQKPPAARSEAGPAARLPRRALVGGRRATRVTGAYSHRHPPARPGGPGVLRGTGAERRFRRAGDDLVVILHLTARASGSSFFRPHSPASRPRRCSSRSPGSSRPMRRWRSARRAA